MCETVTYCVTYGLYIHCYESWGFIDCFFFVRIHKQTFLFLFRLISKNSLLHMILLWLILFDPIILLNMIHFLQNLHWNDCFPVNQWCFSWWLVLLQCKVETFSFFEDSFYVLPFVVLSPVILLLSFTIHMLLAFMLCLYAAFAAFSSLILDRCS